MMRILKATAWTFWLLALIALILGVYTSNWKKVPGSIASQGSFGTYYGGYSTLYASRGGYLRFDKAQYSYWYEDRHYWGRVICICIPFRVLDKAPDGQTVPVYVSTHAPQFSVLEVGPDYFAVLLLIVIGAAPFYLAHVLEKLVQTTNI